MTRLETKADAHGEQLTTISNDVAEIKELVARGRGAVALGRVVAAGFWAVIGFIGSLLLRK